MPGIRATLDNLSQTDGSILHPRYKTGLVATMKVSYVIAVDGSFPGDYVPACEQDLREMHEILTGALNSIRTLTPSDQRLIWSPTGASSERMLDFVQCQAWADPSVDGTEWSVTFAIETELPYAIDLTQIDTPVPAGSSPTTIVNDGTSDMLPVVKVWGPFTAFVLLNESVLDDFGNALEVVYDATRPGGVVVGAGHYAAIDFFRGTIYLDGNSTDLTGGLDPAYTDFFPLAYGSAGNDIEISGADCDFLWNPAWS